MAKLIYRVIGIPQVWRRGPSRKNLVVLKTDRDWLVVDPGAAVNAPFVLDRIEKWNLSIVATLITHAHPDHGSAAFQRGLVRAGFSGTTYAPRTDLRRMNGVFLLNHEITELRKRDPGIAHQVFPIHLRPFRHYLVRWAYGPQNPPTATFIDPGQTIHGFRVIGLPGHTPDELGYWHEASRTLVTGDLIQFEHHDSVHYSLLLTRSDVDDALSSTRAILKLRPRTMLPSHGRVLENDPVRIRQLLRQGIVDYEKARHAAAAYDPRDILGFAKQLPRLLPNPGYNWLERRCTALALLRSAHQSS